ncbi:hypothetical protein H5410_048551 [Solanum commersonii]|uniref:Uncharacterized protein n=1 Tax=Solanum commersonii TaxID=4109 RepID=A0A9J5XJZ6_SOLCO|nr:hypothetical protein H5410_048551 [Solanum commersonii]
MFNGQDGCAPEWDDSGQQTNNNKLLNVNHHIISLFEFTRSNDGCRQAKLANPRGSSEPFQWKITLFIVHGLINFFTFI